MNAERNRRANTKGESSMRLNRTHITSTLLLAMLVSAGLTPRRLRAQQTSTLTIQVTGLKNANGQVCIRLWNKKDGFPTDDRKALRAIEVPIINGSASAVFTAIPFGTYAVSTWHDENKNGKFDTRFPGIPLEGYGISNGTRGKLGPPPFDPSIFPVHNIATTVPVAIRY
jgi:uncharacterized protein (DUF2141 family)